MSLLVVSIQLPHRLFLISHNPYKLSSVLAQMHPLACKHIQYTYKYIHKHRQTESWHLLTVLCNGHFCEEPNIIFNIITKSPYLGMDKALLLIVVMALLLLTSSEKCGNPSKLPLMYPCENPCDESRRKFLCAYAYTASL